MTNSQQPNYYLQIQMVQMMVRCHNHRIVLNCHMNLQCIELELELVVVELAELVVLAVHTTRHTNK